MGVLKADRLSECYLITFNVCLCSKIEIHLLCQTAFKRYSVCTTENHIKQTLWVCPELDPAEGIRGFIMD